MSPQLPFQPNLEHLKRQAKNLLRAHQRGDAAVCVTLRQLRQLSKASDAEILSAHTTLRQAQHALAKSYGFTNWAALKVAVDGLSDTTSFVVPRTALTELPRPARVHELEARTWLEPIPRYPWKVEYLDDRGQVIRVEQERTWRLLGNLFAAMRLHDNSVTWEQVSAASGECFRFTFEENWAQDAEYVTPVDAVDCACKTLGFACTQIMDADLATTLQAIDDGLRRGCPAMVGMESRFWRVIVGLDRDTQTYCGIGGVPFEGWETLRVQEGTAVAPHITPDECLQMSVPKEDWYNAVMSPAQAAMNPAILVGDRRPLMIRESVARTLELALELHERRIIERANLDYRRRAVEMGCPGHDGWKFYYSPWPGTFTTGTEGYRAWAGTISGMTTPSNDFEMIHGNDVTFGVQVRKMHEAAAYLGWAAQQVAHPARAHLLSARRLFKEAAHTDLRMLCRWRTCYDGNLDAPEADITQEALLRRLQSEPGLVYLISERHRQLLGELGDGAHGSPWGYRLLPDQDTFEQARETGSRNLGRIADLRDDAFSEIRAARKLL